MLIAYIVPMTFQERQRVFRLKQVARNLIPSTQLLDHMFIRHFPAYPIRDPEDVRVFNRT